MGSDSGLSEGTEVRERWGGERYGKPGVMMKASRLHSLNICFLSGFLCGLEHIQGERSPVQASEKGVGQEALKEYARMLQAVS